MFQTHSIPQTRLDIETRICSTLDKSYNIIESVTRMSGVTHTAMGGKSRKTELVVARHLTFYLLRIHTELTLKEIAKKINQHFPQDHSTIIHGSTSCYNSLTVNDEKYTTLFNKVKRDMQENYGIELLIKNPKTMVI